MYGTAVVKVYHLPGVRKMIDSSVAHPDQSPLPQTHFLLPLPEAASDNKGTQTGKTYHILHLAYKLATQA